MLDMKNEIAPASFVQKFWREWLENSSHFPIANIVLEFLLEGGERYLLRPDLYALLIASFLQAGILAHRERLAPRFVLLGNLAGVTFYTVAEFLLEGAVFFQAPHHLAYWMFSLVIGGIQAFRSAGVWNDFWIVLETFMRSVLVLAMYIIFENLTNPAQVLSWQVFFQDASHEYIAILTILLGLVNGFAVRQSDRYLQIIRKITAQLQQYSEWLLGRRLLQRALQNPGDPLSLHREVRTILFMDLRGFTSWSETHAPNEVIRLLNGYFRISEEVLEQHDVIKLKFTGDEVMAVLVEPALALQAAYALQNRLRPFFERYGIGAGIGLHLGPVVEGLLGAQEVKAYDVIGDVVNTTKRLESLAQAGEIVLSAAFREACDLPVNVPPEEVRLKGKQQPMRIYRIREAA